MALPWEVLDRFETEDEGTLELRKRGKNDFLITVGTQILMNSKAQRSEMALGKLGCRKLKDHSAPRVLVGGLGMAITLRAVLDELPKKAEVVVAELNPKIKEWCLGPLAELTNGASADPRVSVHIGDVAELIKKSENQSFDAIIFDLYRGPHPKTDRRNDPLYGSRAIENCRLALKKDGVFAIWGENLMLASRVASLLRGLQSTVNAPEKVATAMPFGSRKKRSPRNCSKIACKKENSAMTTDNEQLINEFDLQGRDFIALCNLLQLAGMASSGGSAKMLIADGQVTVDGQVELRKRCKIKPGQVAQFDGKQIKVV